MEKITKVMLNINRARGRKQLDPPAGTANGRAGGVCSIQMITTRD
jgi:hypothetical protein